MSNGSMNAFVYLKSSFGFTFTSFTFSFFSYFNCENMEKNSLKLFAFFITMKKIVFNKKIIVEDAIVDLSKAQELTPKFLFKKKRSVNRTKEITLQKRVIKFTFISAIFVGILIFSIG